MGDSILDTANQVINQTILWSCKGFLKLASGDVLLMSITLIYVDFVAKIRHTIIIIGINGGTLSIYSNRLNIQSTTYDNAPFQVINENLANKYIEEQFNDFRQYTIGSYLMVKPGSTIYKLTSEGLWVG